jgi:hypothetical protein
MDAAMQTFLERQDKLIEKLTTILELLQRQTVPVDNAEREKAEARARLEAEKKQRLIDLENEFRTKYAEAGIADDLAPIAGADNAAPPQAFKRAEHPKGDQIGILDPFPAHLRSAKRLTYIMSRISSRTNSDEHCRSLCLLTGRRPMR